MTGMRVIVVRGFRRDAHPTRCLRVECAPGAPRTSGTDDDLKRGADDRADGQGEFARKFPIALIVRGDGHDRASPVTGQDVVGDPDRDALAADRVDGERPGPDADLFFRKFGAVEVAFARGLFPIIADVWPLILGDDHLYQ